MMQLERLGHDVAAAETPPLRLPEPTADGPHPLRQLVLSRVREFYREPEAIFWVYGFPLLMAMALGIAFRNRPQQTIVVDVQQAPAAARVLEALDTGAAETGQPSPEGVTPNTVFKARISSTDEARRRLRSGRTSLVIVPAAGAASAAPLASDALEYVYDPTRPEGLAARAAVDEHLQRIAGRADAIATTDREFTETGSRYIDYLIPGLIGLNLMGGGLWGVGFLVVDMRVRHLLKRFVTTPMRKSHFLLSLMFSRFFFNLTEVGLLLLFAYLVFGVRNVGSWGAVVVFVLLGDFAFAGLGLLVASRAKTLETASGLLNLAMMPMWLLCGAFFSYERFPEATHAAIRLLPLTALADGLRAVMIEGTSLAGLVPEMAVLAGWMVGCFWLALRLFRWQ
ncbi:MAG: ABC transporter permease [Pirellulales bacterium]|nr:ABC transporter permease [Pirellulales bacterium]